MWFNKEKRYRIYYESLYYTLQDTAISFHMTIDELKKGIESGKKLFLLEYSDDIQCRKKDLSAEVDKFVKEKEQQIYDKYGFKDNIKVTSVIEDYYLNKKIRCGLFGILE